MFKQHCYGSHFIRNEHCNTCYRRGPIVQFDQAIPSRASAENCRAIAVAV
ncbi:hypothetical protein RBWH47_00704 [Rhodopirellula baltica WH47]|uniref:Uncharacterized protein n=1 Tax=Rhodopirellula baltica WH47 TaxID=991778 RepID=F2AQV1_RHOBT|nr:hypothetical protein RBWH47_00704 [Rhodopirellula baltica WH47]